MVFLVDVFKAKFFKSQYVKGWKRLSWDQNHFRSNSSAGSKNGYPYNSNGKIRHILQGGKLIQSLPSAGRQSRERNLCELEGRRGRQSQDA